MTDLHVVGEYCIKCLFKFWLDGNDTYFNCWTKYLLMLEMVMILDTSKYLNLQISGGAGYDHLRYGDQFGTKVSNDF